MSAHVDSYRAVLSGESLFDNDQRLAIDILMLGGGYIDRAFIARVYIHGTVYATNPAQ